MTTYANYLAAAGYSAKQIRDIKSGKSGRIDRSDANKIKKLEPPSPQAKKYWGTLRKKKIK